MKRVGRIAAMGNGIDQRFDRRQRVEDLVRYIGVGQHGPDGGRRRRDRQRGDDGPSEPPGA